VTDVAAIILAAGRSRRMGRFKPLLPFGNQTVIESCVSNLRAANVAEIVVVLGHRAEDAREQLKLASVAFVTNPNPDSEMSASIALGVDALADIARAALITPVDHPAIHPETIGLLIEKWRGGTKLIQPEFEGKGGHPVLIDLSYRDELKRLDPSAGLRGFFNKHRADVLRLPVDSPFVARDMDTWEDYCALHEDVFGRKPRETADLAEPKCLTNGKPKRLI
jgi:CTP:molybdopterin cytidylyltransferase MocA